MENIIINQIRKTPLKSLLSLHEKYNDMVYDIRKSPKNVIKYTTIFKEIFSSHSIKLVTDSVNVLYFSQRVKDNDDTLTNFGAIVLGVNHIHNVDSVKFTVELLICSQHENAKIVEINSLDLNSYQWIESLGVPYRYKEISAIRDAIKIMSEFAPQTIIYTYSGWSMVKSNTYIFEGREICAEQKHITEKQHADTL
jgi:hypothetical protein